MTSAQQQDMGNHLQDAEVLFGGKVEPNAAGKVQRPVGPWLHATWALAAATQYDARHLACWLAPTVPTMLGIRGTARNSGKYASRNDIHTLVTRVGQLSYYAKQSCCHA